MGARAPEAADPGNRTQPWARGGSTTPPKGGLAPPPWRLPALHSPFGETEKGKQAYPAPSTTGAMTRDHLHRDWLASVIHPSYYVDMSRHMDAKKSQAAFAALAQPTRLKAFRKLVATHPNGLPAGEIAQFCKVPHNTMSTHLAALMRGGLIAVARQGRSMNYRANLDGFRGLIDFMLRDCCGGRPEICAPVVEDFNAACCAKAAS